MSYDYDSLYAELQSMFPRRFFSLDVSRISTGVEGAVPRKAIWCLSFGPSEQTRAFSANGLLVKVRADVAEAALPSVPVGRIGSVSP